MLVLKSLPRYLKEYIEVQCEGVRSQLGVTFQFSV